MGWRVVERHIGRAGGLRQRTAKQRQWDCQYGEGNWQVGYVLGGRFVPQEEALEDLAELRRLARVLRNPHAEATTGVDLQVPAILTYLERHGLRLQGTEVVDIGSWQGQASHPLSVRLSPLHIRVAGDHKMTRSSSGRARSAWPSGKRRDSRIPVPTE